MPDHRFYERLPPLPLFDLIRSTGAECLRMTIDRPIADVATLDAAGEDSVTFCADARFADALGATSASACFVPEALARRVPMSCAALVTPHPQAAYAVAAEALFRERRHSPQSPPIAS